MPIRPRARQRLPELKPLVAGLIVSLAVADASGAPLSARAVDAAGRAPFSTGATRAVTSCADDGSAGTLRSIVAGAASGDTIDLSQLTCGTITLVSGQIDVHVADLTLVGPGRDLLTIDGNDAARVILHDGGGTLTVSALTVAHGRADDAAGIPDVFAASRGGCILSEDSWASNGSGTVVLIDAAVDSCTAVHTTGTLSSAVMGGGVNAAREVTLTRSIVSNNVAQGLVNEGDPYPGAHAYGGGVSISVSNYSSLFGGVYCTDSIVSGNRAITSQDESTTTERNAAGGGIFSKNRAVIENSIVANNFAGCEA
ncbi:MAG TPA: hypothetical protein VGC30_01095, partial [Dokdonella sp.]